MASWQHNKRNGVKITWRVSIRQRKITKNNISIAASASSMASKKIMKNKRSVNKRRSEESEMACVQSAKPCNDIIQ